MTLNTIDLDFNEERIDNISDMTVDFIEEITEPKDIDFTEIFTNQDLISYMNSLTDKQREILFLKYVKELEEKEIAARLDISIQAVNKTKKVAVYKIKRQLGGARK
ncbi:sigma-70 family RNA polymerase sigma factor [Brassicibacter mesophilus]|uniref:sigma-70 family RNA polymerase sigma factor n=1 Tax=Brassicibacter mesophilus TaxID=745119 RepID=UPI003D228E3E